MTMSTRTSLGNGPSCSTLLLCPDLINHHNLRHVVLLQEERTCMWGLSFLLFVLSQELAMFCACLVNLANHGQVCCEYPWHSLHACIDTIVNAGTSPTASMEALPLPSDQSAHVMSERACLHRLTIVNVGTWPTARLRAWRRCHCQAVVSSSRSAHVMSECACLPGLTIANVDARTMARSRAWRRCHHRLSLRSLNAR